MEQDTAPEVIVIGAGPVGLAAALLLAQAGRRVTVYEAKADIPLTDDNSYPIGVNPRGQETLRRIDPALLDRLAEHGELVRGWRIFAGGRLVAKLPSGTVLSTTRAFVNRILLEKAESEPNVTVVTGHKLTSVDIAGRTLTFAHGDEEVTVEAGEAQVIAADGVWSHARRAMAAQIDGFSPEVGAWGVRFRVLYSEPGAKAPGLDPSLHYIFGDKGMYSATLAGEQWCVVVTAIDGAADEPLLLATDASEENVAALQAYVREHAPLTAPLLSHDDYAAFFARDSFTGAVVRCPYVNAGEWLVLLGDAAHGVIPPTGEGINSGLEDAALLTGHLLSGSATPFADFNAARMPDLTALGEYAWFLMENVKSTDPARRVATVMLRIANGLLKPTGYRAAQVEDMLFGPSSDRTPYATILGPWIRQKNRAFPPLYRVFRGVFGLVGKVRGRR